MSNARFDEESWQACGDGDHEGEGNGDAEGEKDGDAHGEREGDGQGEAEGEVLAHVRKGDVSVIGPLNGD